MAERNKGRVHRKASAICDGHHRTAVGGCPIEWRVGGAQPVEANAPKPRAYRFLYARPVNQFTSVSMIGRTASCSAWDTRERSAFGWPLAATLNSMSGSSCA